MENENNNSNLQEELDYYKRLEDYNNQDKRKKSDICTVCSVIALVVSVGMIFLLTGPFVPDFITVYMPYVIATLLQGGLILAIVAIVYDTTNVKPKVVLGVYIVGIIIFVFTMIYMMIWAVRMLNQCLIDCENMGPMP